MGVADGAGIRDAHGPGRDATHVLVSRASIAPPKDRLHAYQTGRKVTEQDELQERRSCRRIRVYPRRWLSTAIEHGWARTAVRIECALRGIVSAAAALADDFFGHGMH